MDGAHTQALETRRRNAEARKQRRAVLDAERRQDEALVSEALRAVLRSPEATAGQRLFAVSVLDRMKYYNFIPHDMRNADTLIADFAKRFEAAQKTETE